MMDAHLVVMMVVKMAPQKKSATEVCLARWTVTTMVAYLAGLKVV